MLRHRDTGEAPPLTTACGKQLLMYIPWELLTIAEVALPESAALRRFEAIAWDSHSTDTKLTRN
jgi:hypothetical protein